MLGLLRAQGLPPDYVQALSIDEGSERAGCALAQPAWLYAGGGWVEPLGLVRSWLDHALIDVRLKSTVDRIESDAHGGWHLLDSNGGTLADCGQLVLANAGGLARLVPDEPWPLLHSRGQVTLMPVPADWRPTLPIAGDGYAIALPQNRLLCGATSDLDDTTPELREADHQRSLSGLPWSHDTGTLDGRVAWRLFARDRLPLLGSVPLAAAQRAAAPRQEQARFIARRPGLHVIAGLGSRGLAQAALAGEVVAAMITGTPLPVGSPLLDAIDAARFAARAMRAPHQ
jgi:tRNA 5-methylaminomethyl-2-thiouridine biosynthesis bifunctional protein